MSNHQQGTPGSEATGAAGGGRPGQPAQEARDTASERRACAKRAGLAAIGGASSGTARVVAASIREALLGGSAPD